MLKGILSRYSSCCLLIILLFSGCVRITAPLIPVSPEPTSAIPLNPAIPTKRNTISPATTIAPSHLPTDTISPTEKAIITSQLLTGDYLCDLPCWGGIEPGVTTISDAISFLKTIATYSVVHNSAEIKYQGKIYFIGISSSNNKVDFLLVPRLEYSLTQLLQKYGKPDEIYLYIVDSLPIDNDNPFSLFLFYKDQGILVEYHGISPKGEILSLCFADAESDQELSSALSLWEKGVNLEFQDVLSNYIDKYYKFSDREYYKLSDLSDYSVDDFYGIVSDIETNKECLQVKNPNGPP